MERETVRNANAQVIIVHDYRGSPTKGTLYRYLGNVRDPYIGAHKYYTFYGFINPEKQV